MNAPGNASPKSARIGFSLATAYLMGKTDQPFERLFGPLDGMLSQLRERGVTSVEMRAVAPSTNPQAILTAANRVFDAGLDLTLHGILPDETMGLEWAAYYPAIMPLLEVMRQRGQTLMIPLHAYQAREGVAAELAERSVQSIRAMAEQADREGWPIQLAVEINRTVRTVDPAVNYEGVLAIVSQVDHPRVGICWDWGHSYANHRNGLIDSLPPTAFLERVSHTHIHGMKNNNPECTHFPLTEDDLPYQSYVQHLVAVGYAGVWNLEISPSRFENEPAAAERILRSIDLLRDAVMAIPSSGVLSGGPH